MEENYKIFDVIRKKFIELTPEEWVRQHLIHFLITDRNYPASLFKIESAVKLNSTHKRSDILIYENTRKPLLLAECKAYSVSLSQNTLEQAMRYNLNYGASIVILSNGLKHYVVKTNENQQVEVLVDIPFY